jgi:hypothetical protein
MAAIAISLCSFSKKPANFQEAMGKGTSVWQYVQTPEDWSNLQFYEELYKKNNQAASEKDASFPKTIHFIWLGPTPFPRASIPNIDKWVKKHPGWTFKFWTDADLPAPHAALQKANVHALHLLFGKMSYQRAENYGEKSQILRYAILLNEGGVYADHDTIPSASFDPLQQQCDFFCGLAPLKPSILSSSIYPVNHLMGAKAGHPIFAAALQWLDRNWQRLEHEYPGTDEASLVNRMSHRTLQALEIGVKNLAGQFANRDVVLPSTFLSLSKGGVFASHLEKGLWYKKTNRTELKVKEQLQDIQDRQHNAFIVMIALAAALLSLIGISYWSFNKRTNV